MERITTGVVGHPLRQHTQIKRDNRALRYEKRLLRAAFEKAKQDNIPSAFYTVRVVREHDPAIYLYARDDRVDISPLLNLVRDDLPSLYRKYITARTL